ncbi:Glycosyl hydrolases family 43 [Stigmatella aurantiaca]|uniref:Glycosyl hydrolases family 43 n=1 Tax=Stigmatella aurantiaca TaxID=41 RepID=A0A1H7NCH2_STIAU|nr:family 43 glycosylhydrolase [Stigmatella aurantiaca]SEL20979.1 Glycosyl hydrolases family 43 [Stigmatella aurantiaca]
MKTQPSNYRPIHPEDVDQGDPYPLAVLEGVEAEYRYYVYVTSDQVSPKAFPVYASNDLVAWRSLGASLVTDPAPRAYWAPCVHYVRGLTRPFVMLYSRSVGAGDEAHVGHTLRRADSERPEGPFIDSGQVLTPDTDFAIDPDLYRAPDGSLRLAYATDFVADAPLGTGIVEVGVSEDLTRVLTPPALLARATDDWHLYDAQRRMPWKQIPGVDWSTDTVVWNTVEAPVGGLVNPRGQRVYLYSGGCFFGFYGVGALVEEAPGRLVNVTRGGQHFVLRPEPARGLHGPGHCAWLRGHDGRDYLFAHARFGSPSAVRNAMIVELRWDEEGLPYCPPFQGLR